MVDQVCVVVNGRVVDSVEVELFVVKLVAEAVLVCVETFVEVDVLRVVTVWTEVV